MRPIFAHRKLCKFDTYPLHIHVHLTVLFSNFLLKKTPRIFYYESIFCERALFSQKNTHLRLIYKSFLQFLINFHKVGLNWPKIIPFVACWVSCSLGFLVQFFLKPKQTLKLPSSKRGSHKNVLIGKVGVGNTIQIHTCLRGN